MLVLVVHDVSCSINPSFARERVSCVRTQLELFAHTSVIVRAGTRVVSGEWGGTLAHIIAPDEFVFQPYAQKCRFSPLAEHVNPFRRSHPDQAHRFYSHGESLKVGGR